MFPSKRIVSKRSPARMALSSVPSRTSVSPRCCATSTASGETSIPTTSCPRLCRCRPTRPAPQPTSSTWWGLISLVIANPFTIVMNLVALVQARRLPPPQLSSI